MANYPKSQKSIEYQPNSHAEAWQVAKFDWLQMDFGVKDESDMPHFHTIGLGVPKAWKLVRMFYGVNPVVVPMDTDADYLPGLPKHRILEQLSMSDKKYRKLMGHLKAAWDDYARTHLSRTDPSTFAPIPVTKQETQPDAPPLVPVAAQERGQGHESKLPPPKLPPLDSERAALLTKYGFPETVFAIPGRHPSEAIAEREWFVRRLADIQNLFEQPAVSSTAHSALLNEVYIYRLNAQLISMPITHPQFKEYSKMKSDLESALQKQWDQIESIIPSASRVGQKINAIGMLWEIFEGVRQWKANDDHRLLDGINTAYEIQVLMREAVQHGIQYRPGQIASILEAMRGVWDKEWKRSFSMSLLKMLDEGFKEGARAAREKMNLDLPDLEQNGAQGEYPPLFKPVPANEHPEQQEAEAMQESDAEPPGNIPIGD